MYLNRPLAGFPVLRLRAQRGITMVETLLSLVVASLMMLMLAQWMKSSSDDLRAKRNADSLQQFAQMAGHYLDANRDAIIGVMSADAVNAATIAEAAKYCVINGNTAQPAFKPRLADGSGSANCAVDAQMLIQKNLLPAGFVTTNPYGQSWVAIYRLVYADYDSNLVIGVDEHQGDVEMLVAATGGEVIPNNELGMTMQLMGGVAGMYPAPAAPIPSCAANTICGPGGWTVNVNAFQFSY